MSKTFVCAHRGASGTQPENTLEAFNEAIKLGCEMIEFDVRMTKDEHLVLLHDPLVDRTTNGNGPIWELLYSEVLDLNVYFENAFLSDTHIPTLDEVLNMIPSNIRLNVHVYPGPQGSNDIVNAVCSDIRTRDLYGSAFIAGTDEVVESVIRIDERVNRCLLGSQGRIDSYAQKARDYGCTSVQPLNSLTTKDFCSSAKELGLEVHPFYADEQLEMQRLIECGVDGILTNYPHLLKNLLVD
tara:strand:- start:14104 stop:14826 length:723 start_codon:yes stop_codon:yes gene_type:complete